LKKPNPKKDELLNQILQEISDENNKLNNSYQERKSQDYNKETSSRRQNIQTIIIGIIVILIIMIFFYLNHETNKIIPNTSQEETSTLSKGTQLYKEQKNTELKTENKEDWNQEVQSIKTEEIIISEEEETHAQEEENLAPKDPETERERAKRILMEQMQN
jgi:cytoskeletal protein RodZ